MERPTLDGDPYTIIGVLPRGFDYPYHSELWLPRNFDRDNGRAHPLNVQARLKAGTSLQQAEIELETIALTLAKQFPETNAGYTMRAVPLREVLVEGQDKVILILLAAVVLLLLIACANIASLLMVRFLGRQKEFAIRAALGASRIRRIRHFLTENVLLSLFGGAGGVLLTFWGRDLLMTLIPHELTYVIPEVPVDLRVLAFTLLLSLVIGVVIAGVPALRVSRFDFNTLLKQGGSSGDEKAGHRMLSVLIIGQTALTLVLLAGSTLMIQNLYRLQRADLGFPTENVLMMKLALAGPKFADPQQRSVLVDQVLDEIRSVPGVDAAAAANLVPLTSGNVTSSFVQAGKPVNPNEQLVVSHRIISDGYFEALKIPLLRGRTFTRDDQSDSQPVVIISRSMAVRYWSGEDPLGQQVRAARGGAPSRWLTIVGIVGDVRETSESREIKETWYLPFAQDPTTDLSPATSSIQLAVRTALEPGGAAQTLKGAIGRVDKNLPLYDIATAESLYRAALSPIRLGTIMSLCFAGFGVLRR